MYNRRAKIHALRIESMSSINSEAGKIAANAEVILPAPCNSLSCVHVLSDLGAKVV
jgi:hypothetical protein